MIPNMITRPEQSNNALAFSQKPVSDASFHDFAYYEYMLPPDGNYLPNGLDLTDVSASEQQEIEIYFRMVTETIYKNIVLYFTTDAYVPSGPESGDNVPQNKTLRDEFVSNYIFNDFRDYKSGYRVRSVLSPF